MKRLLIILIILLPTLAQAQSIDWTKPFDISRMNVGIVGAGGAAATVYTDCSNVGTSVFYWTGEHSSGSGYACFGSTATNRSGITAEIVASSTDPGVVSPESGGNVIHADASSEYVSWAISGCSSGNCNIVDTNIGTIEMDVYLGTSAASTQLVKIQYNSANNITIDVLSSNTVNFQLIGNNVIAGGTTTGTISDTTWTKIKMGWSRAANKTGLKIGSGSWYTVCPSGCTTTGLDVTAFQGDPTIFRFPNVSNTEIVYLDNIRVYKSAPSDW